ncbi:MAG TPA: hypothetical protein VH643_14485 [Gemmataceae bacterium]
MNCTVIQRRLLSAEHPDQPAADVRSHLNQCPACRAWQRRLVQVERQIPLLPVPPSTRRTELLQRILGPVPGDVAHQPIAEPPNHWRHTLAPGPKERGLRKLSVAFALAASLLIVALACWFWPKDSPRPTPPVVVKQTHGLEQRLRKVLLVEKRQERIRQLAGLAKEVHDEARGLVDDTEKLSQWAEFYSRLVGEELLEQARQLPPGERPAVLEEVAKGLGGTESNASRTAASLERSAPKSAASFKQIALAARRSERDLRALLRG